MQNKFAYIMGIIAILIAVIARPALSLSPADTLRNENGEIINVPPPGEPGVDFVKQQFTASLKTEFLRNSRFCCVSRKK